MTRGKGSSHATRDIHSWHQQQSRRPRSLAGTGWGRRPGTASAWTCGRLVIRGLIGRLSLIPLLLSAKATMKVPPMRWMVEADGGGTALVARLAATIDFKSWPPIGVSIQPIHA